EAVPPLAEVRLQLTVLEPPSAIVPSVTGVAGVTVHPSGARRLTVAPEMEPGPELATVALTVAVSPGDSVIGVGGSSASETAADSGRSTARPPNSAIVTARLVDSSPVWTWSVAMAASYDQPGPLSPGPRRASGRPSTVTRSGAVRSTRSTS